MKDKLKTKEQLIKGLRNKLSQLVVDNQTGKTATELMEEGFKKEYRIIQLAMDTLPEPIILINKEYVITWMNRVAKEILTRTDRPLSTLLCYSCQHEKAYPCHIDGETCPLKKVSESNLPLTIIHKHHLSNGEIRDFEIIAAPLLSKEGKFEGIVQAMRDITERKRMEEKLQVLATTDELTGLYNRRGFFAIAEQQLKTAKRLERGLLLLSADLDNLKEINDKFGHQEGDIVLIEVANVFKESFRESDVVARIGGDEFVVFQMENIKTSTEIMTARLQEKLDLLNEKMGKYLLSVSVGIAHSDPESTCSVYELLTQADKLMYEKKKQKQKLQLKQLHLKTNGIN
jgi:diguanylate cyclase (GGDEF)-like protein